MTLLSWDIPLISFNGSLWDVLLRCSKWLLGAWLDSFTMILRCWLVVWVKWARPLVSMTLWSRVMFNWKAVQLKGRPISWAVLHHRKSMGQIWVPSCPPGVQLLPHFEVWSYRACQPLQMWQISHFCEIHSLSYEASNFFRNVKSMGQIWDAPAPQGCNFYPILRYGLTEPASLFKCGDSYVSTKFSLWATTRQSFPNTLSMGLFGRLFAPGANIVPPIAYKSHSTRFPIRPHVLTPHSWLCDKNCGRSSAPK